MRLATAALLSAAALRPRAGGPPRMCAHPPGAHGSHVLLDFVGFRGPAAESGEWMLATLRETVASHGVREVHSKLVVLGERGESPPGFTAVALLDESHTTAHCYSDRGLLAIDVFTCGSHDPRPIAADIRRRVEEHVPAARCVMEQTVGRFMTIGEEAEHMAERAEPCEQPAASAPRKQEAATTARGERVRRARRVRFRARGASPPQPRAHASRMLLSDGAGGGGNGADGADGAASGSDDAADAVVEAPDETSTAASAPDDALRSAFASRLEKEGGVTSYQLERSARTVQRTSAELGQAVSRTLDLDGEAAKRAARRSPGGGRAGVLDTASWRLTVAFFGAVVALSAYGAVTTDFGDDSDATRPSAPTTEIGRPSVPGTQES